MRKSSLSRAQRNFQVFNQNDHVNKYESLRDIPVIDVSDEEKESPQAVVRGPVIEVDSETDQESGQESTTRVAAAVPDQEQEPEVEGLQNNDDFIALSDSSEDEELAETSQNGSKEQEGEEEQEREAGQSVNTDYPWILNHDHSKQKEIADWLTMEIRDFVAYISPSRQEIEVRNNTIRTLRKAVMQLWPDADLQVFGSYATDLYLPGSDIDCVVNSKSRDKETRSSLYSLASFLKQRKLATQVEVIAKARVPIIKFVEPKSQIHVDVSFERINGLEAAKLIRSWLEDTLGLRELVLIVKQFLHSRRLNNVHTGGLGGFSIICLVYSFLRLHPRIVTGEIDPQDNLGVLLIEFFELYGKNFGYDDVAVTVSDNRPGYLPKNEWRELQPARGTFSLAIQDPGDSTNNISRSSFNLRDIKKAFAGAFDLLTNRCFELEGATYKDRVGKSILGNVIKYRGKLRDFNDDRSLVANRAIIENENYHKRRSRIVHEEVFVDPSESESETLKEEQDIYHIEGPPKKKRQTKSVDELMGIGNEEEDDYNPLSRENEDATLKKITVDAQTKRDYWLNKGNSLSK
ncbi:related to Poly(A) RNA polymerase protein 1 [Zygosaccharomyces bailii]|nr:related to Poly(A) RNA polymerase protein 1 [Zygosaccharomyces bailii]